MRLKSFRKLYRCLPMDDQKSKSERKREADSIQKIGVKLIALSLEKLDTLPLSPRLRQAVVEAKHLKSHGAIRRQAQLIGKLMRGDECDRLLSAYQQLLERDSAITVDFHEVEVWRSRLMKEGSDALTAFIAHYNPDDHVRLRQLIKKAIAEADKEPSTGAKKALFRYIRVYVQNEL